MTPIIIDTDMGNDDIVAICMLLLSKKFSVKAISIVNGVASTDAGTKNLAKILAFIGRTDIPIISGAQQALLEKKAAFPLIDRQRANNLSLLPELNIPQFSLTRMPISNSLDSLSQIIFNQKPTILCFGPLTNIARLITKYGQKFTSQIPQVFVMGGAISAGNVPPKNICEYNVYLDPEAAKKIFSSNIPITLVPVDATKFVPAKKDKINKSFYQQLKNSQPTNKLSLIIKTILLNNRTDFYYFYDPLLAAILEKPTISTVVSKAKIKVVLKGQNRGKTLKDNTKKGKVKIISQINSQSFYNLLLNKTNS